MRAEHAATLVPSFLISASAGLPISSQKSPDAARAAGWRR
jgi:hypothetical protein